VAKDFGPLLLKLWWLSGSCCCAFGAEQTDPWTRTSGAELVACDTARMFLGIRLALGTTESGLWAPSGTLCVLGNSDGREVALEQRLPAPHSEHAQKAADQRGTLVCCQHSM